MHQLETSLKEVTDKWQTSKQNVEMLTKQKKELKEEIDRTNFSLKKQIHVLEQLRDEYLRKNASQQNSIEQMLQQIGMFQSELDLLLKQNTSLNERAKKATSAGEAYKRKYVQLKEVLKRDLGQEFLENAD